MRDNMRDGSNADCSSHLSTLNIGIFVNPLTEYIWEAYLALDNDERENNRIAIKWQSIIFIFNYINLYT